MQLFICFGWLIWLVVKTPIWMAFGVQLKHMIYFPLMIFGPQVPGLHYFLGSVCGVSNLYEPEYLISGPGLLPGCVCVCEFVWRGMSGQLSWYVLLLVTCKTQACFCSFLPRNNLVVITFPAASMIVFSHTEKKMGGPMFEDTITVKPVWLDSRWILNATWWQLCLAWKSCILFWAQNMSICNAW